MTHRAFIFGVNTKGLKYCETDVQKMRACLSPHGYEITMPDPTGGKREINAKFDSWLDQISQEDTLIVYFSGHGYLHRGNLVLVVGDDETRNSKYNVNLLTDGLADCTARHKLLILDCCHSGRG